MTTTSTPTVLPQWMRDLQTTTPATDGLWRAENEAKDPTAKRGYRTITLATGVTREEADRVAREAAEAHAAETGHELDAAQVYLPRSFYYCAGCTQTCFNVSRAKGRR